MKLLTLTICVFLSTVAIAAPSVFTKGRNFSAPAVGGISHVYNPEVGAIVYDISDSTFYGYNHSNSWVILGNSEPTIPTGTILPYVGTTAPSGYLMCDGQSYSRAAYPDLATVLGCSGSTCAYGAADSTHFTAPDMRGLFMRGANNGKTGSFFDPQASTRTGVTGGNTGDAVGSLQMDEFGSHTHGTSSNNIVLSNGTGLFAAGAFGSQGGVENTGGAETRPKNVYVNYIIKY